MFYVIYKVTMYKGIHLQPNCFLIINKFRELCFLFTRDNTVNTKFDRANY